MKHRISPLLLAIVLSLLSLGWSRGTSLSPGLERPVSMTLADDRLLVSDTHTGLHIYDVSNLRAPEKIIQIPVQGNLSSAVKDDIIYTNDVSQLQAIRLTDDGYEVVARIGVKYRDDDAVHAPLPGPDGSFSCFCSNRYRRPG